MACYYFYSLPIKQKTCFKAEKPEFRNQKRDQWILVLKYIYNTTNLPQPKKVTFRVAWKWSNYCSVVVGIKLHFFLFYCWTSKIALRIVAWFGKQEQTFFSFVFWVSFIYAGLYVCTNAVFGYCTVTSEVTNNFCNRVTGLLDTNGWSCSMVCSIAGTMRQSTKDTESKWYKKGKWKNHYKREKEKILYKDMQKKEMHKIESWFKKRRGSWASF